MLEVQARVNGELVGTMRITNREPCEHMAEDTCDCIGTYSVADGPPIVRHRRSDSVWWLVARALQHGLGEDPLLAEGGV